MMGLVNYPVALSGSSQYFYQYWMQTIAGYPANRNRISGTSLVFTVSHQTFVAQLIARQKKSSLTSTFITLHNSEKLPTDDARYALQKEMGVWLLAKGAGSKTYCCPTDHYASFHRRIKFLHMHNQSTAGVTAITPIIPQGKIVLGHF